ncbi:serine hydrolase [Mesobacillus jeotgali]|uniref:Serine hydrolase n=1 Tax=Mesobacillus jeotgali TaxID=129985 RepID=A0ABY9VNW7_9BACI|nr:serine hydrolase [Mesobacillus jeotgali]WNF22681.1 serine hydrolase [Mesobacillus jeotgali]
MSFIKKILIALLSLLVLLPSVLPAQIAQAATISAYQTFNNNVSKELKQYIKKSGGTITLHYRDLTTGEEFKLNSTSARKAASTIKLPLALYVMELAAAKKINLNEKLTYKRHHYYGGSGVIQKQRFGTKYSIRDLVKKSMIHSDNIAFIMLRERVGKNNFIAYMKKVGGKNAYPGGQNITSSTDLVVYANRLYTFSRTNPLGKELVDYLKKTDYNTTIPRGVKGVPVAHKVGMIPMSRIYNDIGIIYDKNPFALAVMTNNLSYTKSQKVIADIASIVFKHHKIKNKVYYVKTKRTTAVYPIPASNETKIGSLTRGESFKISADKVDWYEIQLGGKKGYLRKTDVYAYLNQPTKGFTNGSLKSNGLVVAKGYTKVLNKPDTKGKVLLYVNKGTSINIYSQSGDYYSLLIGNRMGYIHKNLLNLQYTSSIKYFEVKQENAEIFTFRNGVYVHMGKLKKGQIFMAKSIGAGPFIQGEIGTGVAYIKKTAATPIFNARINNSAAKLPVKGSILLDQEEAVYSSQNGNSADIIGKISKNQKVSYVKLENGYYEINFLGRKGYIKNKGSNI